MEENEVKKIAEELGCKLLGIQVWSKSNGRKNQYMFGIPTPKDGKPTTRIIYICEFSKEALAKKIEEVKGERW